MRTFKVNTIAHQLKQQVIAKYGDIVTEEQLNGNADELVLNGFVVEILEVQEEPELIADLGTLDEAKDTDELNGTDSLNIDNVGLNDLNVKDEEIQDQFTELTLKELKVIAEDNGIEVAKNAKKADILEAIRAKLANSN